MNNIPVKILEKTNINLHTQKNHPLEIIKNKIYGYFSNEFQTFDNLNKYVSLEDNFDNLLIPKDHPCRSKSDTYYSTENSVLRTQTSAHQTMLLKQGISKFLVTGDVYRKDEIDRSHYPVFHQMECVCVVQDDKDPKEDLLKVLVGLVKYLFGDDCEYRISDDYFPFTNPSFEIEIKSKACGDKWLEVLGCGVMQQQILDNCGFHNNKAWAFGLGLERLAMILFDIPDIRYFWTSDPKFIEQFKDGKITKFKPYSVLDPLVKDISFYIPEQYLTKSSEGTQTWTEQNNFYQLCRDYCDNDLIEDIELCDIFFNKKLGKLSHCYHITYKPVDSKLKSGSVFNKITNDIHRKISENIEKTLCVKLR
jgi:phenylalanyl-tRNA synthetase alpha chain